jgi:hypothetical protein
VFLNSLCFHVQINSSVDIGLLKLVVVEALEAEEPSCKDTPLIFYLATGDREEALSVEAAYQGVKHRFLSIHSFSLDLAVLNEVGFVLLTT